MGKWKISRAKVLDRDAAADILSPFSPVSIALLGMSEGWKEDGHRKGKGHHKYIRTDLDLSNLLLLLPLSQPWPRGRKDEELNENY